MSLRLFRLTRGICLVPLAVALAFQPAALAQDGCGTCATGACGSCAQEGCCHSHCPPCFPHCTEGPPRIKFQCGCPKPVCPPDCDTPNWGFYETCWHPGAWTSRCPVPPALGCLGPNGSGPSIAPIPAGEPVPSPQKIDPNPRKSL